MNGYEMLHKAWNSKGEMPFCVPRSSIIFQGHTVQNITDFDPNWAFPDYRPVAAFKSLRFALFHMWLEFITGELKRSSPSGFISGHIIPVWCVQLSHIFLWSTWCIIFPWLFCIHNLRTSCKAHTEAVEAWSDIGSDTTIMIYLD